MGKLLPKFPHSAFSLIIPHSSEQVYWHPPSPCLHPPSASLQPPSRCLYQPSLNTSHLPYQEVIKKTPFHPQESIALQGTKVSIRPTTGIKPLYTTIATVTMNLIVSAAIILLNLYVAYGISCQIPHVVLSICFPDVSASTCVEADPKVSHELHSCDKAFGRLHHSGNSLGLHRVPYK